MATGITYTLLDFVFNCSPSPYIPLNRVALTQFCSGVCIDMCCIAIPSYSVVL